MNRSIDLGYLLLLAVVGISVHGCVRSRETVDLVQRYSQTVRSPEYDRNPVIVIPGILGSRLVDSESGKTVWGSFDSNSIDPKKPAGARLAALPMAEGWQLAELTDNVQPDGVLQQLTFKVLGWYVDVDPYSDALSRVGLTRNRNQTLSQGAAVDYSKLINFHAFDYDWRRDISESAVRLHEFIAEKRRQIQEEYQRKYGIVNADIKFDIVAHSMGGLVARYYLRYGPQPLPADGALPRLTWEGSRYVQQVVLVAPPNAGSLVALTELREGDQPAPILPKYEAAILGTMPSLYQLLPRPRHGAYVNADEHEQRLDIYDANVWEQLGWGLAAPDQDKILKMLLPDVQDRKERLWIALEHQRKCLFRARQLHAALDIPASLPDHLSIHLFAGDATETDEVVGIDLKSGDVTVVRQSPGDGVVTRASALMDERVGRQGFLGFTSPVGWTSKTFLRSDHRGLTHDPLFRNNVLSLLLEPTATALEISAGQHR